MNQKKSKKTEVLPLSISPELEEKLKQRTAAGLTNAEALASILVDGNIGFSGITRTQPLT